MSQYPSLSRCEKTGKTRFPTPGDAKEAIIRIKAKVDVYDSVSRKRIKRRNGKAEQCRYYRCNHCLGYHLTSQSSPTKIRNIKKQIKEQAKSREGLVVTEQEVSDWKADSLPFPTQPTNDEMV